MQEALWQVEAIVMRRYVSDQGGVAYQCPREAPVPEKVQREHVCQQVHPILVAEARRDHRVHISRAYVLQADKEMLHHEAWVNLPTQKGGNVQPHKNPQSILAAGGWRCKASADHTHQHWEAWLNNFEHGHC